MSGLILTRDDELGPDALALIAQSEAELAAIYPAEVRYAFSPSELRDAGVCFVVGHIEDMPVACGGVALLEGYGELKRIFVTRSHRGGGFADAIVAELEQIAILNGRSSMRLETGEASPEAIRFYTRLGYSRIGPFGAYAENGSSVFMEKNL